MTGAGFSAAAAEDEADEPFARVDAKRLEAALLKLRHPIVTVPLLLEAPGVTEARAERVKLLVLITVCLWVAWANTRDLAGFWGIGW